MNTTKSFNVAVGSGIIAIFRRVSFKLERVFAEFIDNSLQSYLDHESQLKSMPDGGKCIVNITSTDKHIVVKDNAFGMNEEEFGRSLQLKATNPNAWKNNQLSVYGMGLKYASVYLGEHYSIDTTAYGSGIRYHGEIDVPEFEKNNPTEIDAKLTDAYSDDHETTIEITQLRVKKTVTREEELRERLAAIYSHYLASGQLAINIGGIPVIYHRPDSRIDENGEKYFRNFSDSFKASGREFSFTGWISILPKGNQAITGLNLIQANRCIELGYKPEELFGKGNSFQNSRVVGEVVFEGQNYVLSFNKDKFVWADDGAEETFIETLKNNPDISYIISKAKNLRQEDDAKEMAEKTKQSLAKKKGTGIKVVEPAPAKPLTSSASKTPISSPSEEKPIDVPEKTGEPLPEKETTSQNEKPVNTVDKSKDPLAVDPEQNSPDPLSGYDRYETKINGKPTTLYVDVCDGKPTDNWIDLERIEDKWVIHINYHNKFIADNFGTQKAKIGSNTLALVFATAVLKAQECGLKLSDSAALIQTINGMMGNTNGNE
jgi:hypothetical protein